jgi:hypothetical protein
MHAVLHTLSVIVLLPYATLAAGFLLLYHAVRRGTLLGLFDALLDAALVLMPWGAIAIACAFAAIVALGITTRYRWLGAACTCLIADLSLLVIIFAPSSAMEPGQWLFLVPCFIVAGYTGWLAATAWPRRNTVS